MEKILAIFLVKNKSFNLFKFKAGRDYEIKIQNNLLFQHELMLKYISPVFPVFNTEETVSNGLKNELRVGTSIPKYCI